MISNILWDIKPNAKGFLDLSIMYIFTAIYFKQEKNANGIYEKYVIQYVIYIFLLN